MKAIFIILSLLSTMLVSGQVHLEKRNETCEGRNDGWLKVIAEGTQGQLQYQWSNGKETPIIYNLAPGDYFVTVSLPGGCSVEKSGRIYPGQKVSAGIQSQLLSIDPHPIPCGTRPSFNYLLTAMPSGGTSPYYCSWAEGGGQSGECSKVASGSFIDETVVVIDANGCVGAAGFKKNAAKKLCPKDPNDIQGPEGYGEEQWISVHDEMNFTVRFENDPIFATSNAALVFITVPIDDDIDPFSFRLNTIGFGDKVIEIPANVSSKQQRLDYSEDLGFMIDLTAGLDVPNNRFFWLLETIDPATGQPPGDPTAGFLPVNDTLTGSGEGFVNYVVKPKTSTSTGELIEQQASIIFDLNDPIVTNTWSNKVDALPPTPSSTPLPDTFYTNEIPFTWNVADDPGGCGVAYTEILLSSNPVSLQPYGFAVDTNGQTISLDWNTKYYYQVRGTDFVDNAGSIQLDSFYIVPERRLEFITDDQIHYCFGDTLWIDVDLTTIEEADLYISIDSGEIYTLLASTISEWPFPLHLDSSWIHEEIFLKVVNDDFELEDISDPFAVHFLPAVTAGPDQSGCSNELLFVEGDGAITYQWFPAVRMGSPDSRVSNVYPEGSEYLWIEGTNEYGCMGVDSLYITIHQTSRDTLIQPLCEGDSININNTWISEEGYYENTYSSIHGCDSTIVTEIYFESPCIWIHGPYVYVDEDATGASNGSSWEDAFTELTDALYVAGRYENVQEIWVAEGIYTPHATRRDTSFIIRDSIKVFGGFLGFEETREERTGNAELVQISGDINVPDTLWDNSYHTTLIANSCVECVIDGVTVQYGYANEAANAQDIGAGVLCEGVVHFNNVIFERNYATELGAALHTSGNASNVIIEDCMFRLNTSSLGRDVVNLGGSQIEFRGANSIH